ncbi:hypothetical protein K8I61_02625 [bacterium]|nr:hypothetical protein [bacterium]
MKMRTLLIVMTIAATSLFVGLAWGESGDGHKGHQHGKMSDMTDMCPMHVADTKVARTDVDGGIAFEFTTSGDNVVELRKRVKVMAAMHDDMGKHPEGMMHGGMHKEGGMMMPASTATSEDIEGGARIVVRPKDAKDLPALREHAGKHMAMMEKGECPMMSNDEEEVSPDADETDHSKHQH